MKLIKLQKLVLLGLLVLLFSSPVYASRGFPALAGSQDAQLQEKLEKLLQDQHLWSQVTQKRLTLVIADISDFNHPRMAQVNDNYMMYAASLPKIAILTGAFIKIERGQLELDALWDDLNRMVRYSDNAAATRVLEQVGEEDLIAILQEPKYHFYDPQQGGGLWVGKPYSKAGAYHRDPLKNLSHGATALQAARVYYMLANGQLLKPELKQKMLQVLSKPAINHKLVKGLRASFPDATLYRKSGTWGPFNSDSLMIESSGHRYLIVCLIDNSRGGEWLVELAEPLLDLLQQQAVPLG